MAQELYLKVKTITLRVTNLKNYIYIYINTINSKISDLIFIL